ncbi:unnamed protein product, partial [Prorocentrum cordatum]
AEIVRLAQRLGMGERTQSVSLGQGQGAKAEGAIAQGREQGLWVILQNCHLAPSWMQKLEVLVEDLNPEKDSGRQVSDAFRLWLTSMPSPQFPVSVLQNGLKMTNEPPKGLKSNLLRAYLSFDDDWFEEACLKSEFCQRAFRKMLFGLCFFHALIQERCSYGALGWNIPYQFSEPDRQICVMQLKMFLEDEYKFSPSGKYYAPPFADLGSYVDYIRSLPINHMPEAFGLHANANLVAAIGEARRGGAALERTRGAKDGEELEAEIRIKMIKLSETFGYTEDAAVSMARNMRQNENCVWIADDPLCDTLFERCRGLLPPEVQGGEVCGFNARWRLYKYGPLDRFKPHIDGSWPGSGLDASGKLVRDRYGDRWSQLTIVFYLNDDFEGGETRFFYPTGATRGGAVCFYHGEHPQSPLHEGGLVTAGTKYIIRSDVLYKLPGSGQDSLQSGWQSHYAQVPPGDAEDMLAESS